MHLYGKRGTHTDDDGDDESSASGMVHSVAIIASVVEMLENTCACECGWVLTRVWTRWREREGEFRCMRDKVWERERGCVKVWACVYEIQAEKINRHAEKEKEIDRMRRKQMDKIDRAMWQCLETRERVTNRKFVELWKGRWKGSLKFHAAFHCKRKRWQKGT